MFCCVTNVGPSTNNWKVSQFCIGKKVPFFNTSAHLLILINLNRVSIASLVDVFLNLCSRNLHSFSVFFFSGVSASSEIWSPRGTR